MGEDSSPPLTTLSREITRKLTRRIVDQVYPPGTKLPTERDLAVEFDVTRHVVREALKRIDEGTFGECEECGEDIGQNRLLARPTATLCVSCKEEQERKEVLTAAGRTSKSLGETMNRKWA